MERYGGLESWLAPASPAQTDNERYYHELAENFLKACPDGPFDYGEIKCFVKAAKTNNTVRGVYAALEDIKGPLPSIAPWEQARIANEKHYRNLAEQMLQGDAHPSMDYASIRQFLRATQNNKTVRGVYAQLEKLIEPARQNSRDWNSSDGRWHGGY